VNVIRNDPDSDPAFGQGTEKTQNVHGYLRIDKTILKICKAEPLYLTASARVPSQSNMASLMIDLGLGGVLEVLLFVPAIFSDILRVECKL
jgi:hypothetical protein